MCSSSARGTRIWSLSGPIGPMGSNRAPGTMLKKKKKLSILIITLYIIPRRQALRRRTKTFRAKRHATAVVKTRCRVTRRCQRGRCAKRRLQIRVAVAVGRSGAVWCIAVAAVGSAHLCRTCGERWAREAEGARWTAVHSPVDHDAALPTTIAVVRCQCAVMQLRCCHPCCHCCCHCCSVAIFALFSRSIRLATGADYDSVSLVQCCQQHCRKPGSKNKSRE